MPLHIKLPWDEEKKRKPIPFRIRKQLMIKGRGACMWCKKQPIQEFHHIDENPRHNRIENIIALCGTCHNKVHSQEFSRELLQKRLWKVLGVKRKPTTRLKPKSRSKRRRALTPLDKVLKQAKKDFG